MRNLPLTFDCSTYSQKLGEDFVKFCGLLRIYELYNWQLRKRHQFSNKFRSFLFCQSFSYSSMTKHDVCDLSFTSRKSCIFFLFAFLFGETNLFDEVSSEWHERGGHNVLKSFLKRTINIFIFHTLDLRDEICFWFKKSIIKYDRKKILKK